MDNIMSGSDDEGDMEILRETPTKERLLHESPVIVTRRKSSAPKVVEEARASGNVKLSLYWKYFQAGSNCCTFSFLIFTNIVTQILFTGSDWWLNFWSVSSTRLVP